MTYCRKPGLGGWRQRRKLLGILQIVFKAPHVSSRLDSRTRSWTMLKVASVEMTFVFIIDLALAWISETLLLAACEFCQRGEGEGW